MFKYFLLINKNVKSKKELKKSKFISCLVIAIKKIFSKKLKFLKFSQHSTFIFDLQTGSFSVFFTYRTFFTMDPQTYFIIQQTTLFKVEDWRILTVKKRLSTDTKIYIIVKSIQYIHCSSQNLKITLYQFWGMCSKNITLK